MKDKQVNIRIDPVLLERLRKAAWKRSKPGAMVSVSCLVREAVEAYLAVR